MLTRPSPLSPKPLPAKDCQGGGGGGCTPITGGVMEWGGGRHASRAVAATMGGEWTSAARRPRRRWRGHARRGRQQ